jgi:hypothetical protein
MARTPHQARHARDVPLVAVQKQQQLFALHVLERRPLQVAAPDGLGRLADGGLVAGHGLGDDARELRQPLEIVRLAEMRIPAVDVEQRQ